MVSSPLFGAPERRSPRRMLVAGIALALAGSLAACGNDNASGDDSGTDKLFIATGGGTANQLIPYLAEVLGYADDEGLDLEVKSLEAQVVATVVAGRADLAEFGAGTALAPVNEGKDTRIVFGIQKGQATGFLAASDGVDTIDDCKTLATHPTGSSSFASASAYKEATGATYQIREFPTPTDVVASVISGQADCAVSSLGILTPGLTQGMHLVIDAREDSQIPPDSVQGTTGVSLWGMHDALSKKKSAVEKLMKALAKVQEYLATATPEDVAAELVKHPDFKANDPAALAKNVEAEMSFFFPNDGRILEEDWAASLEYYKVGNPSIDPSAEPWSYESRVDMSYFDAIN